MRRSKGRWLAAVALPAAMLAAITGPGSASASGSSFSFANFEPAGLSSLGIDEGGGTVGTTCPAATASAEKNCWNIAAEPQIRADGAGEFYASSENGLGAGTEAWKSTDGGRHYVTLASPDAGSTTNNTGVAPGGGDTDLAVGDDKNSSGYYPVHVASLSLADVDVANSQDGGKSWQLTPTGAVVGGDDREWIAADDSHQLFGLPVEGGDKVCISYHDVATFTIHVDCSYNGGQTFTQTASAFDASHAWLSDENEIGNLAIARDTYDGDGTAGNHNIYEIFSGVANATEAAADDVCVTTCPYGYHVVWLAVSTDGGLTFTDYPVYDNPNTSVSYGHQFVNVSVDRKGNIYAVYSDNHNVYYSYARAGSGAFYSHWHGPYKISTTPANTAIEPWSVAGDAGKLDVVYYGTSFYKSGRVPDNYPSSAAWHVYLAQNLDVFSHPGSFTQVAASPVNHYGAVCEGGVSCTGNRDLYDDFGVAASPTNGGLASIVYSDDQFSNSTSSAKSPNSPSCTVAATNTASCDHTEFATQLSGPGIY